MVVINWSSFSLLDEFLLPALEYTWEISKLHWFSQISKFLLVTTCYVPVYTANLQILSYSFYSSSHPLHVKNFIPYSQFLRDFDVYVVMTPIFRAKQWRCASSSKNVAILCLWIRQAIIAPINLINSQHYKRHKNIRMTIPFTLTFHPHNHAVKSIILNNFKLRQNDPETGRIFLQPPLISFKRDKTVRNVLVRSAPKTNEQPGTFKCACLQYKTCLFIVNTSKISGPKRSVKITDRFTCTSANVIYCITCTLCNKLYIGETGKGLGDRCYEHLRDVEKNDNDVSKPFARHFNLPNHSEHHMAVCNFSLHLGRTESHKNLQQKFIFQSAPLILTVLTNAFHLTNILLFFTLPCYHQ